MNRRLFSVILAAGLSLVAIACAPDPLQLSRPGPKQLQGAVVILLDTVRADHLSSYGYSRLTTPHIDSLAREGVLFREAVSWSPWTQPSVLAMLSGSFPSPKDRVELEYSVVEDLYRAGYATAAFTEGGFVSREFGMDLGFSDFDEEEGVIQMRTSADLRNPNPQGGVERTFEYASRWLRAHADERFFLFIHTYEPHAPYNHREFAEGMDPGDLGEDFPLAVVRRMRAGELELNTEEIDYARALYDGDLAETDRHVGNLLSLLEELGLENRTLVVVTSDHGEEFGEHFPTRTGDHGHSLRDNLLLVPLILRNPLVRYTVSEVVVPVRLVDVLPTVAELLRAPIEAPRDGKSLVPLMTGEESRGRTAMLGDTSRGPYRVGVRKDGFKFIFTRHPRTEGHPLVPPPPRIQLYDLSTDPGERVNLAGSRPDLVNEMRQFLERHHPRIRGRLLQERPQTVDPDLQNRLRSLGYMD